MNRTALCIRMLQLLKSRGFMTREEIAAELETNVRNIAEYRKELEMAGYRIDSLSGKYGGYTLLSDVLLPAATFQEKEKQGLREVQNYLKAHPELLWGKDVNQAIDKMLSNTPLSVPHTDFYVDQRQPLISSVMQEYIDQMKEAIRSYRCVEITYRSLQDHRVKTFIIHPYELLHYQGAYYCIAYSLLAKDFRTYKFSEQRMKQCRVLDRHFHREMFDVRKHIGKSGLIKGEAIEVDMHIMKETGVLMSERQVGVHPYFEWLDEDTLYYRTIFESHQEAMRFLLSLGSNAKVITPVSLCEDLIVESKKILDSYTKQGST